MKTVFVGQVAGLQAKFLEEAAIELSRLPVPQDPEAKEAFQVEVESTFFDYERNLAGFVIRKFKQGFDANDIVEAHEVYVVDKDGAPPRMTRATYTHFYPRGRASLKVTGIDEQGAPVVTETDIK